MVLSTLYLRNRQEYPDTYERFSKDQINEARDLVIKRYPNFKGDGSRYDSQDNQHISLRREQVVFEGIDDSELMKKVIAVLNPDEGFYIYQGMDVTEDNLRFQSIDDIIRMIDRNT